MPSFSKALEPRRRIPVVVGLTALAILAGLEDFGHQVPTVVVGTWILLAGLLLAERYRPGLLAVAPSVFRGAALVAVAGVVLTYVAMLQIQVAPAALAWWAATVVFIAGAHRDGSLGPVVPRRAVMGWPRRIVTAGVALVLVAMASNWLGNMHYRYTVGDWYTQGTVSGGTANDLGRAAWPVALALVALLAASWDERSAWWPRLRLAVPAVAGILGVVALHAMISDNRHWNEITRNGAAYVLAAGPWVLFAASLVLGAGGLMLWRVRDAGAR